MKTPHPKRRARGLVAVALLVLLLWIAAPMPAGASDNNPGTIKVHDEAEADPDQRNEPHVDCEDFWMQGFNLADSSGSLVFYSWPPTGDKSVVLTADWTADSGDEDGWGFLEGPFTLPAGHYRVEAFGSTGHPGGNSGHFAKAKMFWVEECPPTPPCEVDCEPPCEVDCEPPCEVDCEPPCEVDCEPQEMLCPTNLGATANGDGSVTLTFTAAPGSDGTNVYRDSGDGFEFIGFVAGDGGTFTDTDTTAGQSYAYTVTGLYGNQESQDCPIIEVTSIPDLPTVVAVSLAGIGGLAAFAMMRRRK